MEGVPVNLKLPTDSETVLEVGVVAALVIMLGAMLFLVVSWGAGSAQRGKRKGEGPPTRGSIPESRHQHTSSVSARRCECVMN
jgi:hypothetical protein